MPYIGRELDRGNYLKLDDISSSFDGSTTTFNLTNGGNAFYPGSAFSILVVLAGVVQEPEAAYQINQTQITFASAPLAGDQFFCIVLGQALGVNTPANGSVNGTQLAKPFNYDNYFYLDDANNRVGVATATPQKPLHVVGEGQFDSVHVLGNLTVDGTTTTLDTVVTEVDRLEVGANNNTVGVAITQSGSGDAAIFMGGNVGINKASPSRYLEIGGTSNNPQIRLSNASGTSSLEVLGNAASGQEIRFGTEASPQAGRIIYHNNDNSLSYSNTGGEKVRITSDGKIGINDATPVTKLVVRDTLQTTANNHYSFIVKGDDNGTDGESAYIFLSAIDASTRGVAIGAELQSSSNDHDLIFKTSDTSATPTEKVRITNTGKVGIGSDTPQSLLEVFGTSPIIRSKHSTSQKYTQINHNGTDGYLDWSSGGLILRGASNTEKLRVGSDGKLTSTRTSTTAYDSAATTNDSGFLLLNHGAAGHATLQFQSLSGGTAQTGQATISSFNETAGSKNTALTFGTRQNSDATIKERLRITSAGKVGIGTDDPAVALDVRNTQPILRLYDTDATNAYTNISNLNGNMYLGARNDSSDGSLLFGGYGGGTFTEFFRASSTVFRIDTNGTERVRVTSSGNVGIKTASPLGDFSVLTDNNGYFTVAGSGGNGAELRFHKKSDKSLTYSIQNNGGGNELVQHVLAHSSGRYSWSIGGTERLRISSDGNLRHSCSGGETIYELKRTDSNTTGAVGTINFLASDDHSVASMSAMGDGDNEGAHIVFRTTSAAANESPYNAATPERVRITSDGNVGIGYATPSQKLVVKGTTSLMATNSTNQWMTYTYTDNTFRLNYNGAGADEITVLSSGEVGVGAFTPGAGDGILQIAGGLRVAGSASASDTTSPYIYRTSGYDHLNFATSGVERLRISSDGKVTITTGANSASPAGSGDNLVIKDSNGCGLSILSGNGNSQNIYLGSTSDNDGTRLEGFYNSGSPYFNIYIANTQRLRISSDGLIDASTNTNAVALPQGTTAQRPSGSAPYIRKNTTNNALEFYNGTEWVEIITDYFPTGSTILG